MALTGSIGGLVAKEQPAIAATAHYLPFKAGQTAHVSQGYGGSVSHKPGTTLHYSLDFDFVKDKPVVATAAGKVKKIVTNVTGQTGSGFGNEVVLQHADGKCTRYAHMKYGSVTNRSIGSSVAAGEQLGLVGNTGYTLPVGGGHHLHFAWVNCSSYASVAGPGFVETNGAIPVEGQWVTSANNGTPTTPTADGSFVGYQGRIYVIAGGAPIYVSHWNNVGGPKPYTELTSAQWSSLRQYPKDGTFIVGAGHVYVVAGGAPIYVSNWNNVGGSKPYVTVDGSAIAHAGEAAPWNHLRKYPADGTFIVGNGYVYVVAGGAPIYVSNWKNVGGAKPFVRVDASAIAHADGVAPWNHLHKYPADGTYVVAGGAVYVVAGGAPIYVSNWSNVGGGKPTVTIDPVAITSARATFPWDHLRQRPADNTILRGFTTGKLYKIVGGAPILGSYSGAYTNVDQVAIDNAGGTGVWSHLAAPAPFKGVSVSGSDVGSLDGRVGLVGDFDGDGRGDVLWWGVGSVGDVLWRGKSGGGFAKVGVTAGAGSGTRPFVGDFNGDGRDDVFWYVPGSGAERVWFGRAAGSGSPFAGRATSPVSGSFVPKAGDFDGDGRDDIYWYSLTSTDRLWRGKADGSFRSVSSVSQRNGVADRGFTADFNGDGRDDLFFYEPGAVKDVVWLGTSSGFKAGPAVSVSGSFRPAAGDFNGDGRADVVWYAPSGTDILWRGLSDGSFDRTNPKISLSSGYVPGVADFNADGKADIYWDSTSGVDRLWHGN